MLFKNHLDTILIFHLIILSKSDCPSRNVTYPFICTKHTNNMKVLHNWNISTKFNITQLALNISEYYGDNVAEKSFYFLHIYNYYIDEFPENCLLDLSFEIIAIGGNGNIIKRIHENAFNSSKNTLVSLSITNANQLLIFQSSYNIYKLINSFPNLKYLSLSATQGYELFENNITNSNLIYLHLSGINTINDYAYFGLKNLKGISLHGDFKYIPPNAFVIDNDIPNTNLTIEIAKSQISESSFGSDVFTNPNRNLNLIFQSNKYLTTLKENQFKQLFLKYPNSTITAVFNNLSCTDCSLQWIFEMKVAIVTKIIGAECADGKSFYNLPVNNFNNCSTINDWKIIIILSSILLIIIVILFLIIIYKRINRNYIKLDNTEILETVLPIDNTERLIKSILQNLEEKNCLIDKNRLQLDSIIGTGNFGSVHKALLNESNDGYTKEVAVKIVHIETDIRGVEACFKEGLIVLDYKHERVLSPIGFCMGDDGYPMILLPLMINGDLLSYLRNEENSIPIKQLLQFGKQIAEGMAYLSSQHFIHRDLAARNCLLDENLCVKICDFGFSRNMYEKSYYRGKSQTPLPLKWMAIESIDSRYYSTQTDVWSFGVLLWEILSRGLEPYPTIENKDILKYLQSGNRLPKPKYCSELLYKLLIQCWSQVPQHRPQFQNITNFISIIINNLTNEFDDFGNSSSA